MCFAVVKLNAERRVYTWVQNYTAGYLLPTYTAIIPHPSIQHYYIKQHFCCVLMATINMKYEADNIRVLGISAAQKQHQLGAHDFKLSRKLKKRC